jgi:hypothetical protein
LQESKPESLILLRLGELLYISFVVLLLYLLVASRTGEASTVWQILDPAFMPTLFVTTSLLFAILLSPERASTKLGLVILYSILIHSLFSIIFPAGDLSGQQSVIGQTRRVFDDTVQHGLSGWPTSTIGVFIIEAFKGINLQAALSTIFARMLAIDVLYIHLSLVPVFWGALIPVGSFLIMRAIGASEKAALLSSLLVSAFPHTIYFGAVSIPNSLGFIFFLYSLYFMLRHLSSDNPRTTHWMLAFSFFSFLSHYLTGIMSFSLVILTIVFKTFRNGRASSTREARILLLVSFLACASLLPTSFIYLRLFGTSVSPVFTLDKLSELPLQEVVGLLLFGELIYGLDLKMIFLIAIGPSLAFLWLIYLLYHLRRNPKAPFRLHIFFLSATFLITLIDYRILKIFMEGLPFSETRIWVFRDLIATPFVALATCAVFSSIAVFLKAKTKVPFSLRALKKNSNPRALSLVLTLNILIVTLLGGWLSFSLNAAYPHVAPLQTTWYELEAVRYIDQNTREGYVVVGDIWTIYAGEVIVGINNPRAYYFGEYDTTGHNLFINMKQDPSPHWMLDAMSYTNTTVAYFIVTEPRLGTEEFNNVVSRALANEQLTLSGVFSDKKLYVFSCRKT